MPVPDSNLAEVDSTLTVIWSNKSSTVRLADNYGRVFTARLTQTDFDRFPLMEGVTLRVTRADQFGRVVLETDEEHLYTGGLEKEHYTVCWTSQQPLGLLYRWNGEHLRHKARKVELHDGHCRFQASLEGRRAGVDQRYLLFDFGVHEGPRTEEPTWLQVREIVMDGNNGVSEIREVGTARRNRSFTNRDPDELPTWANRVMQQFVRTGAIPHGHQFEPTPA